MFFERLTLLILWPLTSWIVSADSSSSRSPENRRRRHRKRMRPPLLCSVCPSSTPPAYLQAWWIQAENGFLFHFVYPLVSFSPANYWATYLMSHLFWEFVFFAPVHWNGHPTHYCFIWFHPGTAPHPDIVKWVCGLHSFVFTTYFVFLLRGLMPLLPDAYPRLQGSAVASGWAALAFVWPNILDCTWHLGTLSALFGSLWFWLWLCTSFHFPSRYWVCEHTIFSVRSYVHFFQCQNHRIYEAFRRG